MIIKQKGFLIAESMIGLTIAIIGVMIMTLTLSSFKKVERNLELKTDRTYAWHVMRKNSLKEVTVHDRVYCLAGKYVYDTTAKENYKIEK